MQKRNIIDGVNRRSIIEPSEVGGFLTKSPILPRTGMYPNTGNRHFSVSSRHSIVEFGRWILVPLIFHEDKDNCHAKNKYYRRSEPQVDNRALGRWWIFHEKHHSCPSLSWCAKTNITHNRLYFGFCPYCFLTLMVHTRHNRPRGLN